MADPHTTSMTDEPAIAGTEFPNDTQNPVTIDQRTPNRTTTSAQRASAIRTDPDLGSHQNHRMSHRWAMRRSAMRHLNHFGLGHARSFSSNNMAFGWNQNGQGNNRVTHPTDETIPRNIAHSFSHTVTISHPYPQESVGVEDTQPHDMPRSAIINVIRLNRNEENNLPPVDPRVHDGSTTVTGGRQVQGSLEAIRPVRVGENAMATAPVEHAYDTERSTDTVEPHRDHHWQVDKETDARRQLTMKGPAIHSGNSAPRTDQAVINPGAVRVNNEIVIPSNQANITTDAPSSKAPSCPQASDNELNVHSPIGCVQQATVQPITRSALFVPKVPSPLDSGDESSGDTVA